MTTDLFHIPETPMPLMEAARQRLTKAIKAEREAERVFEMQGPEAMPALQYARKARAVLTQVVEKWERDAIRGAKS